MIDRLIKWIKAKFRNEDNEYFTDIEYSYQPEILFLINRKHSKYIEYEEIC